MIVIYFLIVFMIYAIGSGMIKRGFQRLVRLWGKYLLTPN